MAFGRGKELSQTQRQIESAEEMVQHYMHTEPTKHAVERFLHWLGVLGNLEQIHEKDSRAKLRSDKTNLPPTNIMPRKR